MPHARTGASAVWSGQARSGPGRLSAKRRGAWTRASARAWGSGTGSGLQWGQHRGVSLTVRPSLHPGCFGQLFVGTELQRCWTCRRFSVPGSERWSLDCDDCVSLDSRGNLWVSFRVSFCTVTVPCFQLCRQHRRRRVCLCVSMSLCVCACVEHLHAWCASAKGVNAGTQWSGVHGPS